MKKVLRKGQNVWKNFTLEEKIATNIKFYENVMMSRLFSCPDVEVVGE